MKIAPNLLFLGGCLLAVAGLAAADDITVNSAEVTDVHSVDPGLKTFVQNELSAPVTRSVAPGGSFEIEVFELYTDENKVNTEEPPGGDTTPKPIQATVTLGAPAPAGTVLTFTGTTYGEEDLSVVPANLQPILQKDPGDITFIEALQLAQWAQANPDAAKVAGGRGVVEWDGPQEFALGDGRKIVVELQKTFYDEGMQFSGAGPGYGTGPGNAGAVTAVVTYDVPTTEDGLPIMKQFALTPTELEVVVPTEFGFTYFLEISFDLMNWEKLEGSDKSGDGTDQTFPVPREEGRVAVFVRVVRTVTPMMIP